MWIRVITIGEIPFFSLDIRLVGRTTSRIINAGVRVIQRIHAAMMIVVNAVPAEE